MTKQPSIEHPASKDAKPPQETWRILFLDSADNIVQLKQACKKDGYAVVGSTTIEEAWSFLNGKDHVDVIVCAAHLEEQSVFKFLQEVRKNVTHGNTAFLIVSLEPSATGARMDRNAERTGILLGANAYLVMPVFDASELITQIRKLQPSIPMLQQSTTREEKRDAE